MPKNKLVVTTLLILGFVIQGFSLAWATDVPTLQWERGREQTITLGGNTDQLLWSINLVKNGKSIGEFKRSSANKDGFYVYSLQISQNFPLGKYEVSVSGPNNPTYTTAYVNILRTISYNPIEDPKTFGAISVIAFTLLSLFSFKTEEASTIGSVDKDQLSLELNGKGIIDRSRLARRKFVLKLDTLRHNSIVDISPKSPLISRILIDSTYLQALFGPLVMLLPIAGAALGFVTAFHSELNLSPVPTAVVPAVLLMALGIFDALSGLVGFITYAIYLIATGNLDNVIVIRTLAGLAIFWFTPILVAGNTRPLRRLTEKYFDLERITDLLLGPLLAGWATKGMLGAIDGFAQQKTNLASNSTGIAIFAGLLILVRLLLEDAAIKFAPARLEFLSPPKVQKQELSSYLFSIFFKIFIFLFFLFGFFGAKWQILVATFFLVGPSLIGKFVKGIPNSPSLYQLIPTGIPGLVVMSFIGYLFSNWVNSWPLLPADKSKTIAVLVGIPGFTISLLKLVGRSPKPGDTKWYLRDSSRATYVFGGAIMILLACGITFGVIP